MIKQKKQVLKELYKKIVSGIAGIALLSSTITPAFAQGANMQNIIQEFQAFIYKQRKDTIRNLEKTRNYLFDKEGNPKFKLKNVFVEDYKNPYLHKLLNTNIIKTVIGVGVESYILKKAYEKIINLL